jgi:hypothetical protein
VNYTPLFYAGSQLVAGLNHAVIAKARASYPDAEAKLATVYLHEHLPTSGGAFSVMSARPFALSPF